VAKADSKSTAVTWNTLQEVHPLVVRICISPSRAGPWLAELIFVDKEVRAEWQEIHPASTSAEIFFRPDRLPTLNFSDNSAETREPTSVESGVVGICPVIMLGIKVVREDIVAQRPGVEAELAQSQQSVTLNVAHATIGEVSFAKPVTRMVRRAMALAAALLRRPAPPAKASVQAPTSKRLWRRGEELDWLFEKKEQNPLSKLFGRKMEWCRKRLREGPAEFAAGEFPWKTAQSILTKLNDLIAGRLVRDPDTGRVVRRNKK
jgi:hypothetical protein